MESCSSETDAYPAAVHVAESTGLDLAVRHEGCYRVTETLCSRCDKKTQLPRIDDVDQDGELYDLQISEA